MEEPTWAAWGRCARAGQAFAQFCFFLPGGARPKCVPCVCSGCGCSGWLSYSLRIRGVSCVNILLRCVRNRRQLPSSRIARCPLSPLPPSQERWRQLLRFSSSFWFFSPRAAVSTHNAAAPANTNRPAAAHRCVCDRLSLPHALAKASHPSPDCSAARGPTWRPLVIKIPAAQYVLYSPSPLRHPPPLAAVAHAPGMVTSLILPACGACAFTQDCEAGKYQVSAGCCA